MWLIVAFVLAALMTLGLSSTPVQAETDNSQSSRSHGNEAVGQTLEEVVVTAQKRQERLQDVPIPVSVVPAAALRDNNQVRIQDYYAEVPGLAMAQSTMGTNTVSIRSIHNGAELGYTFRASVNVPISSDLALRASAFTRQDSGYIDNPVLHINGVNEDHVSGGHIVALWTPLENLSIGVWEAMKTPTRS